MAAGQNLTLATPPRSVVTLQWALCPQKREAVTIWLCALVENPFLHFFQQMHTKLQTRKIFSFSLDLVLVVWGASWVFRPGSFSALQTIPFWENCLLSVVNLNCYKYTWQRFPSQVKWVYEIVSSFLGKRKSPLCNITVVWCGVLQAKCNERDIRIRLWRNFLPTEWHVHLKTERSCTRISSLQTTDPDFHPSQGTDLQMLVSVTRPIPTGVVPTPKCKISKDMQVNRERYGDATSEKLIGPLIQRSIAWSLRLPLI